jgi:4-hydroxy-3-methylbut-2-en-1-yl diphosphate synthase IspG/GcpE
MNMQIHIHLYIDIHAIHIHTCIGTNHGSLSARVMSFWGDSPKGMVESAIEFAKICRKNDYHNFLFSMKASNPLVMVQVHIEINIFRCIRQFFFKRFYDTMPS